MKKIILILAAALIPFSTMAQDETKVRVQEAGIGFSGLNSFALIYKIGNQKSLWRFNTLFIQSQNSNEEADSLTKESRYFSYGLKAGKEFRKTIATNLELRYGADVTFDYSYRKQENIDISTGNDYEENYLYEVYRYSPGIGLVFGLNYVVKEKLVIGAEILPYFQYDLGKTTGGARQPSEVTTDESGFSYGLSNQSVLLSILYRF
jgi:hypothetical protein